MGDLVGAMTWAAVAIVFAAALCRLVAAGAHALIARSRRRAEIVPFGQRRG